MLFADGAYLEQYTAAPRSGAKPHGVPFQYHIVLPNVERARKRTKSENKTWESKNEEQMQNNPEQLAATTLCWIVE